MKVNATHPDEYIANIADDKRAMVEQLRAVITANIPEGFDERMSYGMIGYVVPHSIFPAGYHCDPKLPLPFVNIAAQKNFVALYHMGIYAKKELLDWFTAEYPNHSKSKLDMGKSCIRFKKIEQIPFDLIGELMQKMTVEDWITTYKSAFNK